MTSEPDMIDANTSALFLDVDGTLLDICTTPSQVAADDQLIEVLHAVSAVLDGALSLVSGRSIDEIDRIFSPARFPAAGAHGAEIRLQPGGGVSADTAAIPPGSIAKLAAFVEERDGLLLEEKRGGVSLHYRRSPQLEQACRSIVNDVLDELGDGYRLIAGKMVFEIAPDSHSKGAAVAIFMEALPFAGRTPVFVGDDVTDEDGFREVNERGGLSIRVGDTDSSAAKHTLPDVASVRAWLQQALLRK